VSRNGARIRDGRLGGLSPSVLTVYTPFRCIYVCPKADAGHICKIGYTDDARSTSEKRGRRGRRASRASKKHQRPVAHLESAFSCVLSLSPSSIPSMTDRMIDRRWRDARQPAGRIHRPRANMTSRDGLISRLLSTEEIDDPHRGGSLERKAFKEEHDARQFVRSFPDVSMNSSNYRAVQISAHCFGPARTRKRSYRRNIIAIR